MNDAEQKATAECEDAAAPCFGDHGASQDSATKAKDASSQQAVNERVNVKQDSASKNDADNDYDERPCKPQPNLPAAAASLAKSDAFRRLEGSVWPEAFRLRMAVPYAEYAERSPLGRINWADYALVEKDDTIRRGHHAVCPLVRSRKTGVIYRCKIMSCSRIHFNLTTLGFKAGREFERELRNCLVERQLLFAFDHPFVRSGLGFFTDQWCNFGVFLEEFPHGTLLDYYEKNENNRIVSDFEEAAVRMLAAQVVLALEYLHCLGCVHRDVQAANLLVDARGYVKLTDFAITAPPTPDGQPLSAVTCFRYYAAPEYFNGKGYSCPVDFYALGLVLYELLMRECFCDQEDVFDAEGRVDWRLASSSSSEQGGDASDETEQRRRLTQKMLDAQAIRGEAMSSCAAVRQAAEAAAAASSSQSNAASSGNGPQRSTPPSPEARAFIEDCLLVEPDCRPDRRTARFYAWFAGVNFDRLYERSLTLPWRPPPNTCVSYQPDVDEEYPLANVLDQKPVSEDMLPYKHLF